MIKVTIGDLVERYGASARCAQQLNGEWQVGVLEDGAASTTWIEQKGEPRRFATLSRAVSYLSNREACLDFVVTGHKVSQGEERPESDRVAEDEDETGLPF